MPLTSLIYHYCLEHGLHIATAESCTGGRIAARLTARAGASSYFTSGIVCYSDEVKHRLLGVSSEALATYSAVSSQVARQMAEGVQHLLSSDIGLSTTGYLGPHVEDGSPIGLVYIGLAYRGETLVHELHLSGPRTSLAEQTVDEALHLLWRQLWQGKH